MAQKKSTTKTIIKRTKAQDFPIQLSPVQWSIALLIITFICFLPALKNGFINWDDNAYVFENPDLNKPLGYFFGEHFYIGNYIPITMVVYALEFRAVGISPGLFHTLNVLLHLANVILVFYFIYFLSEKKAGVAAIVSLFFAIHPMHVESVAWVSELKDVLYTFFFLGALILYLKFVTKNKDKKGMHFPWLVLVFFVLSCLSKPAAVVLPLVLLLLDFYLRRSSTKQVWLEKIPFFLISMVFGMIAIQAQASDRLLHDYYPLSQKICFASYSLLVYLFKFFVPINLSIFYPYPELVDGALPALMYTPPFLVLALFFMVYKSLKHSRLLAFGFLFFLVNLILVLQLVSIGEAILAERYTYLAYIGLLFILAMKFHNRYSSSITQESNKRGIGLALIVLPAFIFALSTHARTKVWLNDDALATDLVNNYPTDRLALNNKGFILYTQKRYTEAIPYFTKATESKPDYVMAWINLADCYLALNNLPQAIEILNQALKQSGNDHHLLNKKGYLLFLNKEYNKAIELYKRSIQEKADNTYPYLNLGECYFVMNNYTESLKWIEQGLQFNPDNHLLLNSKGYLLFTMHRYKDAIPFYNAALTNKPDYIVASNNLNECLRVMHDSLNNVR